MNEKSFKLLKFMQEEFGDFGPAYVAQELKELGFGSLEGLSTEQQDALVESILKNVFAKNMSAQKLAIKRISLQSIMRERESEPTEESHKTRALLGIPKISFEFPSKSSESDEALKKGRKNARILSDSATKRIFFISMIILAVVVFVILAVTDIFGISKIGEEKNESIGSKTNEFDAEIFNNSNSSAKPNLNVLQAGEFPSQNQSNIPNTSLGSFGEIPQNSTDSAGSDALKHSDASSAPDLPELPDSTGIPEITTNNNSTPAFNSSLPIPDNSSTVCDESRVGKIFFDPNTLHFYGCDGAEWKQLDN